MGSLCEEDVNADCAKTKQTFFLLSQEHHTAREVFDQEYHRIFSKNWLDAGTARRFLAKAITSSATMRGKRSSSYEVPISRSSPTSLVDNRDQAEISA